MPQWRAHLLARLAREITASGDRELEELLAELSGYPGGVAAREETDAIIVPMRLRTDAGVLSMLSVTTVFGTPLDVTVAELAIESFYPADAATRELLTR